MCAKDLKVSQFGRILLPPDLHFMRSVDHTDIAVTPTKWREDGLLAAYAVESCIAFGATSIAINSDSTNSACVSSLATQLRKRVTVIDKRGYVRHSVTSILKPIADEHQVTIENNGLFVISKSKSRYYEEIEGTYRNLYPFLLGCKYNLVVQIDIALLRRSISKLLRVSRDPSSRANLAIVKGILAPYSSKPLDTLSLRSGKAAELKRRFDDFVEDETFQEMSRHVHGLGIPLQARHALVCIRRNLRELVNKRAFKPVFDLATTVVSAATKLPAPESDLADLLHRREYLPPIMNIIDYVHMPGRAVKSSDRRNGESIVQVVSVLSHTRFEA